MTPEEKRIKIAEACGWTFTKIPNEFMYISHSPDGSTSDVRNFGDVSHLPDYLNDLNAMHEAEKTLSAELLWYMTAMLAQVVPANTPIAHATAAQRAEAFLRTIGKKGER